MIKTAFIKTKKDMIFLGIKRSKNKKLSIWEFIDFYESQIESNAEIFNEVFKMAQNYIDLKLVKY
jgi:hypothetical protein